MVFFDLFCFHYNVHKNRKWAEYISFVFGCQGPNNEVLNSATTTDQTLKR